MAGAIQAVNRWLPALAVVVAGLAASGAGFQNGDAAVYAHQAAAGVLHERVVHIAWIAVTAALAPIVGGLLPVVADALVVLCAAVAVAAIGRSTGVRAGWAAAAVVLPVCAFAEVDVPWAATLVVAAVVGSARTAGLLAALAVAVSPVALLGVPWVAAHRGDRGPVVGAGAAVLALTVVTAGAWWIGDRGVLHADGIAPWAALGAWGRWPWWVVLAGAVPERRHGWLGLLLLAPTDVPAWLLVGWALALTVRRPPTIWLAAVVLLGAVGLGVHRLHVARDDAFVREIAAALGPGDGLVAPWTWGVRVSLLATGDPYGLVWRPVDGFVRDQADRWCVNPPARALVLTGRTMTHGAPPLGDCPAAAAR